MFVIFVYVIEIENNTLNIKTCASGMFAGACVPVSLFEAPKFEKTKYSIAYCSVVRFWPRFWPDRHITILLPEVFSY